MSSPLPSDPLNLVHSSDSGCANEEAKTDKKQIAQLWKSTDVCVQRYKAVESAEMQIGTKETSAADAWKIARHLELIPLDAVVTTDAKELTQARKKEGEFVRLAKKMTR